MSDNSVTYWDNRFYSGDWEQKGGRQQTRNFAESQVKYFEIPNDFNGTILDFGCGLGDAIPVYAAHFPYAKLIGTDFSKEAIKKCKEKFGKIAEFICCDFTQVPSVDIIIASNVIEHLQDDVKIADFLKHKCKILFIIVPYKEDLDSDVEHINRYDERSFGNMGKKRYRVFNCRGWSQYGFDLWYSTYFKNILRFLAGRKRIKVRQQIMFIFN